MEPQVRCHRKVKGTRESVMLKVQANKLGSVAILRLEGKVVNGEIEVLRHVVESLDGINAIVLDLGRVTIVDARGLGLFLELRQECQDNGVRFKLINLNKQVSRVFQIVHLDSVFDITTGVEFFQPYRTGSRAYVTALRPCA